MSLVNDSLPSGGLWTQPGDTWVKRPLGSSLEGQFHPTGVLTLTGDTEKSSPPKKPLGFWPEESLEGDVAQGYPSPDRVHGLASPRAAPGWEFCAQRKGKSLFQPRTRTRSPCQVRRGVFHSLHPVSKHLHALNDLITRKRTYLVNVISNLY